MSWKTRSTLELLKLLLPYVIAAAVLAGILKLLGVE